MKPRIIFCPFCRSEMSPGQLLCRNCGMMFCPNCRNQIPKGSSLCPVCGFLYMPEQPERTAPPTKSAGSTKHRISIPRASRPGPQPDTQTAAPYPAHMDHATREQHNCPQCGTNIDKASGVCPRCGLLFESNHTVMQQQQKPHKAQPARPSATPTSQSITSQGKPKVKPEPATAKIEFARVEEKKPVSQTPIETLLETAGKPADKEQEPVTQAHSATPTATAGVPAAAEKQPVTQELLMAHPEIAEIPAPKAKGLLMALPEIAEISAPKAKALLVALPEIAEISAPKAKDSFIQAIIEMPPKTVETPVLEEKEPVKQAIIEMQPETIETPAPEEKEPAAQAFIGWQLPQTTILDKPTEMELNQSDMEKRAQLIEEAITSYGVEAKVVQINVGPTVTQFGVEPGWDHKYKKIRERDKDGNINIRMEEVSKTRVKVDRISALASDLALALAAPSIRIEAPVPGKSIVGIEVPNTTFDLVNLRGVIDSIAFQKAYTKSKLAVALGKGAGGEIVAAELDKMPHLLIAGATGSGKTACLNSVICSLLIHNTPDDVQFIMIDPKRVELVNFNSLPHLIAPVIVDTDKAILALRWLNREMDNRYQKFAQVAARNIESYNKNRQHGEAMSYIVLVIDELADLMMAAFDEVEHTLCRLAQLARATGIHLIVATQRPSVDVVTGLIKANFPTRISFALTSQVDSRTILDSAGAEKLLGKGDMLYLPTDSSKPKRLQGTFASDAEIDRIVNFWGNQIRHEVTPIRFEEMSQLVSAEKDDEDALMEAARQLSKQQKNISTSFLQRRLGIGYPRAARIMDKLEEEGYDRGAAESYGK